LISAIASCLRVRAFERGDLDGVEAHGQNTRRRNPDDRHELREETAALRRRRPSSAQRKQRVQQRWRRTRCIDALKS
jgi:hypothetical protein